MDSAEEESGRRIPYRPFLYPIVLIVVILSYFSWARWLCYGVETGLLVWWVPGDYGCGLGFVDQAAIYLAVLAAYLLAGMLLLRVLVIVLNVAGKLDAVKEKRR